MAKNPYINIYGGNPTNGEEDGILLSSDGSFTTPFSVLFDIEKGVTFRCEELGISYKIVKLAFRVESEFEANDKYGEYGVRWRTSISVRNDEEEIGGIQRWRWRVSAYPNIWYNPDMPAEGSNDPESMSQNDWLTNIKIPNSNGVVKAGKNSVFYVRLAHYDGEGLSAQMNRDLGLEITSLIYPR